jgi:hypothetical protein
MTMPLIRSLQMTKDKTPVPSMEYHPYDIKLLGGPTMRAEIQGKIGTA